ncbi:MAG TPA: PAS domain-containing protein [Sphingomicrobium sp.]|nr:PAS domain-containing protein [Sphingomicrobium sp.]
MRSSIAAPAKQRDYLDVAIAAVRGRRDWRPVLDELPVPVYTTDADGSVTYWNQACVDFAGREPQLGQDRWCVTWQLYTLSGDPMPHDQCPMARAIKEKREIRNEIIIVERPDGRRAACRPYPTPYFDEAGRLQGAVNLIVDVTVEQVDALADQAARCMRLARSTTDVQTSRILTDMARDYASTAEKLRSGL